MRKPQFHQFAGLLFIVGAVLVNLPYTRLIMIFDYPDILRAPPGEVLSRLAAGGGGLVLTWLAFAWTPFPILCAIILLGRVMEAEAPSLVASATTFGVIAAITQMIGLLRWVFVNPLLAHLYTDPAASQATREAVVVVFQAIHQYGGVVIGEHLGQAFTVAWTFTISLAMLRSPLFRRWTAWFGLAAAGVYVLAQSELLATAMPAFPVVPEAGLAGSLLWLVWLVLIGIGLLTHPPRQALQQAAGSGQRA